MVRYPKTEPRNAAKLNTGKWRFKKAESTSFYGIVMENRKMGRKTFRWMIWISSSHYYARRGKTLRPENCYLNNCKLLILRGYTVWGTTVVEDPHSPNMVFDVKFRDFIISGFIHEVRSTLDIFQRIWKEVLRAE